MPRSRAIEMPQQPSLRAPPKLRTSSRSDSNPLHNRPIRTDKSPRLSNGRSPRCSSEPLNQKKLGTRISDLESQLGQAQSELKCLKNQLVSAEAAKKAAQELLDKKSKRQRNIPQISNKKEACGDDDDNVQDETDVFEVSVEKVVVEPKTELDPSADQHQDQDKVNTKSIGLSTESPFDELKSMLDLRDKEVEALRQENEKLKSQIHDKSTKLSSAESEITELSLRFATVNDEVEKRAISGSHLNEKLEASEKAKEGIENEMKRLRVQTEQWRKAAESAASVLAGEDEINGGRMPERCGSMDNKYYGRAFEYDDSEDVFGGGKRKVSGIRMFGDLWRKKGH